MGRYPLLDPVLFKLAAGVRGLGEGVVPAARRLIDEVDFEEEIWIARPSWCIQERRCRSSLPLSSS